MNLLLFDGVIKLLSVSPALIFNRSYYCNQRKLHIISSSFNKYSSLLVHFSTSSIILEMLVWNVSQFSFFLNWKFLFFNSLLLQVSKTILQKFFLKMSGFLSLWQHFWGIYFWRWGTMPLLALLFFVLHLSSFWTLTLPERHKGGIPLWCLPLGFHWNMKRHKDASCRRQNDTKKNTHRDIGQLPTRQD